MVGHPTPVRIVSNFPDETLLEFMLSCDKTEHELHFSESYRKIFFLQYNASKPSVAEDMRQINGERYTTLHMVNDSRLFMIFPRLQPITMSGKYSTTPYVPETDIDTNLEITNSILVLLESFDFIFTDEVFERLQQLP